MRPRRIRFSNTKCFEKPTIVNDTIALSSDEEDCVFDHGQNPSDVDEVSGELVTSVGTGKESIENYQSVGMVCDTYCLLSFIFF